MSLTKTTILVFIALVLLTVGAIYFLYGELFLRWRPWQVSAIISLITVLTAYACAINLFLVPKTGDIWVLCIWTFIPLEILILYPGRDELGLISDDKGIYLIAMLWLIHGGGVYLIYEQIKKLKHLQDE